MTTDVLPEPDEEICTVTEESPETGLVHVPIVIPPYTATEMSPIKPIGPRSRTFRPAEDFRERRKESTEPRQMWFEDIVTRLYVAMGCSSAPFAFVDADGVAYYLDAGCVIAVNKGVLMALRNGDGGVVREVFPTAVFWRARIGQAGDDLLDAEIDRLAAAIRNRAAASGNESTRTNPLRTALGRAELKELLHRLWEEQRGLCKLCGAPIAPGEPNPMLQMSPDRIVSSDGSYGENNLQVVHMACNLAKNRFTGSQFDEWLASVRSVTIASWDAIRHLLVAPM
jgi:hypothetical protein